MTAPHEALESVAERARRALRDNEESRPQAPVEGRGPLPAASPEPTWQETVGLVQRRVEAIRLVRELEPRRLSFRQRVAELSSRLARTETDSVHYAQLLERLAEAHGHLVRLEGQIEEAQHLIRSSEWLLDLLTDPTRAGGSPAGEELKPLAR
ncbi:MAG: hypothetical protein ACOY93_02775 [Bacillota bacterium]